MADGGHFEKRPENVFRGSRKSQRAKITTKNGFIVIKLVEKDLLHLNVGTMGKK